MYAQNAVLESPLVPYIFAKEVGICRGHHELRRFFEALRKHKPPIRQYYRTGYFTDGKKLIWEYPRVTPKRDQIDFAEAMEINNKGLIQHHSVYWGWFGLRVLQRDESTKRKKHAGRRADEGNRRLDFRDKWHRGTIFGIPATGETAIVMV